MSASLRKVLIDSHVAAITIAVLLFSSLDAAFYALYALRDPAYRAVLFLITAVTIRGIPYISRAPDYATRMQLPIILSCLISCLSNLLAAWLLSRWVYGVGPLRSLGSYRNKLSRKTHA